jgi:hypothetical protein
MPIDEPSQAGLTNSGKPEPLRHGGEVAGVASSITIGSGTGRPAACQSNLRPPFVHPERRGHDAAAGVGNAHQFQRALDRAVFAIAPVQRNERARESPPARRACARRIEGVRVDALAPQAPPERANRCSATPRARRNGRRRVPRPFRNRVTVHFAHPSPQPVCRERRRSNRRPS